MGRKKLQHEDYMSIILRKNVSARPKQFNCQHEVRRIIVPPMSTLKTASFLQSSGNLQADRRYEYAVALAERGESEAALELLEQASDLTPDWPVLPFTRGQILTDMGRADEAIESFKTTLRLDPEDHQGALVKLQLLGAPAIEPTLPSAFVETLFDQYAPRFDEHLLETLEYSVPRKIHALYETLRPAANDHIRMLDLGCGTGLAGECFVKKNAWLDGVDISSGMLAIAETKGLYSRLIHRDIDDYLRESEERYDLILAADVLIYMGDLTSLFSKLKARMNPRALFIFSLQKLEEESADTPEFHLEETQRFSYRRAYIERLIAASGLTLSHIGETVLRKDRGDDVPGYIIACEHVESLSETMPPPQWKLRSNREPKSE